MNRYSLNPELSAKLKKGWDKIGLKKFKIAYLGLMDITAIAIIEKESRRIARCLVDESLSLETIKRIIGCNVKS